MFARLIAILAVLHGTVFLGAGNALEHLVHQMQAETSGHHGHHQHHQHHHPQHPQHQQGHHQSDKTSGGMTDEEWMNCVFCLDGLMGTAISVDWLAIEFAVVLNSATQSLEHFPHPESGFHARAPPQLS